MRGTKFNVGDRVRIKSIDWYHDNMNKDGVVIGNYVDFIPEMSNYCGKVFTIVHYNDVYYNMKEEPWHLYTDEMIEGLVEEETPKFKVNDIVFVKNAGWVRITNSYWDSLANEYIYEAIGLDGKEYDSINQSNIECQMLPESENPHTGGNKITLDEYKNNDKEWLFNKLAMLDNITALESIQDIFNHLQQSKYPKTYEECCKIMGVNPTNDLDICEHCDYKTEITFYEDSLLEKIEALYRLIICRDAYWKIAGEEMGLGKPWENGRCEVVYGICRDYDDIVKQDDNWGGAHIFEFPIREMRDAFYENFKELIEDCKELL